MVRTKLITQLTTRAMKQMAKQGVGHSNLEKFVEKVRKENKKKNKKS